MTAADSTLIETSLRRFGWIYFSIGNVLIIIYSALIQLVTEPPLKQVADGQLQWLFHRVLNGLFRSYGMYGGLYRLSFK